MGHRIGLYAHSWRRKDGFVTLLLLFSKAGAHCGV